MEGAAEMQTNSNLDMMDYLALELRENRSTTKLNSIHSDAVPIACRICRAQVGDLDGLKSHYLEVHSKEELVETLLSHLHPKTGLRHAAPVSTKTTQKIAVRKTSSIHTCPVCDKQISGKGNLDKHLVRHKTLKPFGCDKCERTFSAKRDLNLHVTRHHSDERPHVCPICSKGFVDKGYLKRHMEFHNENRMFACKECEKSFNTEIGLYKHSKTHNPERPFMCEVCSKCFRAKYDLTAHKRNIHK